MQNLRRMKAKWLTWVRAEILPSKPMNRAAVVASTKQMKGRSYPCYRLVFNHSLSCQGKCCGTNTNTKNTGVCEQDLAQVTAEH